MSASLSNELPNSLSNEMMTPEQVRHRIIDDHVIIRAALDELDAIVVDFFGDEPERCRALRERGLAFFKVFSSHLSLEDALLVSALRNLEDGDELADRLVCEHREQRELIAYLLDGLEDNARPVALVASELRSFSHLVRIDMENEEVTILRRGLLSDD